MNHKVDIYRHILTHFNRMAYNYNSLCRILIFIIFVSFGVCSFSFCQNGLSPNHPDSDVFVSYDLSQAIATKRLSEIISEIKFTRLEETDQSLIDYVNDYHLINGKIIFKGVSNSDIYIFKETGEFESKFNRRGGGPEEYSMISNLWINKDTVCIYVRGKEIKKYDLKGNFLESTKVDILANHLTRYSNGFALDTRYATLKDSLYFDFTIMDKEFKVRSMHLPYRPQGNARFLIQTSSVFPYGDGVIYNGIMRDTIYYSDSNGFRPLMHFDLGSKWFFNQTSNAPRDLFERVQKSGQYWSLKVRPEEKLLYLMGFGGEEGNNAFLIDRYTKRSVRLNMLKRNREETFLFYVSFWYAGALYGYMQSTDVAELITELDESQFSFNLGTTLDVINSSENPVLFKVKFKDSSVWK